MNIIHLDHGFCYYRNLIYDGVYKVQIQLQVSRVQNEIRAIVAPFTAINTLIIVKHLF